MDTEANTLSPAATGQIPDIHPVLTWPKFRSEAEWKAEQEAAVGYNVPGVRCRFPLGTARWVASIRAHHVITSGAAKLARDRAEAQRRADMAGVL